MIKPSDMYISKEEFEKIILDSEFKFMKERAEMDPKDRKKCVQFWVPLTPNDIPVEYIYDLQASYFDAGWRNVQVVFVSDRTTSLMVYLSMD